MLKPTHVDKSYSILTPNFSHLLGDIDSFFFACTIMIISSIEVDKSFIDLSV